MQGLGVSTVWTIKNLGFHPMRTIEVKDPTFQDVFPYCNIQGKTLCKDSACPFYCILNVMTFQCLSTWSFIVA